MFKRFVNIRVPGDGNTTVASELVVSGGKVSSIPAAGVVTAGGDEQWVNLGGALILPGVIDTHVHFDDPGYTHREDFTSGTAAAAAQLLAPSRFSLAKYPEYPSEKDLVQQEPRIGVFVCHCGSNVGGYLDVPSVAEYASTLPGVVFAEDNLYTCSQDTIAHIIEEVINRDLNRVVVDYCTLLTKEHLFKDALRNDGIKPNIFEMENIRNKC